MKIRFLAMSAIVAAVYIAVTMPTFMISFGQVQFRVAEILNHLVVFNPRYMVGIVIGVFISNATLSSVGPIDLIFGVGHTIITLGILILICKFVKNIWARLVINTFLFTFTMVIIASELHLVLDFPFWETWLLVAIGEFVVLAIGAPIMHKLNERLHFKNLI